MNNLTFEERFAGRLSEHSGFKVGQEDSLIMMMQEEIGSCVTGVWSTLDEVIYAAYSEKQNWDLVFKIVEEEFPAFYDVGYFKPEDMVIHDTV